MVIKTIPWHYAGFRRLTNYLAKERGKEGSIDLEIQHNLRHTRSLAEIVEQFKLNDQHRRERVRGVCLYHEILSFHGEDRASITPEIIEDLTRTYLELRAPNALGFAMVHGDREHLHVHLMISGNEFGSPKATRLDQARFRSVRREIESYQIEHYGAELEHSIAHTAKHLKRKERKAQKERVKKEIQRCLDQSDNPRLLYDQRYGKFVQHQPALRTKQIVYSLSLKLSLLLTSECLCLDFFKLGNPCGFLLRREQEDSHDTPKRNGTL